MKCLITQYCCVFFCMCYLWMFELWSLPTLVNTFALGYRGDVNVKKSDTLNGKYWKWWIVYCGWILIFSGGREFEKFLVFVCDRMIAWQYCLNETWWILRVVLWWNFRQQFLRLAHRPNLEGVTVYYNFFMQ